MVSGDWPREPFYGLVSQALNAEVSPHTPVDTLSQLAAERGVTADPDWGRASSPSTSSKSSSSRSS